MMLAAADSVTVVSQATKMEVDVFILDNRVDESAAKELRRQSEQVQLKVMRAGPITGQCTSAILMSRIKRVQSAERETCSFTYTDPDVQKFCEENNIEPRAAEILKQQ